MMKKYIFVEFRLRLGLGAFNLLPFLFLLFIYSTILWVSWLSNFLLNSMFVPECFFNEIL